MCCFVRKRCWVLTGGLLLVTVTSGFLYINVKHMLFIIYVRQVDV